MANVIRNLVLTVISLSFVNTDTPLKFYQEKKFHEAQELTDANIKEIAQMSNREHFKKVLNQILIPRVVGTINHEKVGNYISNEMKNLGWDVQENIFPDHTPVFGTLNFRNIIATLNPNADRYLVLACHYDSKYTREHVFIGATDSAVPCAMLLNMAAVMSKQLESKKNSSPSLMFIFFDGEEAFRQWGPKDSIYGARHLAKMWHGTPYKDGANHLQRLDVLMLLDLLGTPDPAFYSYFKSTEKWYIRLASAEQRLAELSQFSAYSRGKAEQTYFRLSSSNAVIEDDHIPFLRRDVDVLHIIPNPFPSVWHTERDDMTALDFNTIDNLNKIFRVFVAEYLHLIS
ncbi:glutaminyl-peptide cyclotransferase-like [Danaus plexippus]|uniref:Glutaminyl-peptide cyclotransferase n=1 Tax=Danaus plexippus plexippus TaxID=278856 RepID=A0A212EI81_DANPL|nr:glutaminyl-peptide cyclotransferase-like [Danaus plexippus]OWR41189.1 Glutaminyl-peptide cyclotransferase [Danaus plexippus plexippus]